jgi:predicted dehydrogenase
LGANDDLNMEIVGEKGALRFSLMEPNWLYFYDGTAEDAPIGGMRGFTRIECVGRYPAPGGVFPSPKAARGWLEGHVESMLNFLTQLNFGQSGHPDFDDAAHVQAVMETAYRSAQEGGLRLEVPSL